MTTPHSFDQALVLDTLAEGHYRGQTHPAYWNMVGPFGGITAATALRAILLHPRLLGEPLSLTVNYAGAPTTGPFTVDATPVRTNRSTQHWNVSIVQTGADGEPVVTTTATAVTAARRDTWSLADMPMPEVPRPDTLQPVPPVPGVEWFNRYDLRPVAGALPRQWNGQGDSSLTQLWMRNSPER
ncbi:MAG: acyl-CoA thioesterase, partial [Giesbergeria sp.]